jgi:hypothetical protein
MEASKATQLGLGRKARLWQNYMVTTEISRRGTIREKFLQVTYTYTLYYGYLNLQTNYLDLNARMLVVQITSFSPPYPVSHNYLATTDLSLGNRLDPAHR